MSMSLFSASHVAKWDKLTGVTDYRDLGNGIGDPGPAHSRTLVLSSRWLRSVHSHSRHLRTARAEMPDAEDECRDDSEEPGGSPVINESGNIAHDVLRPYHLDSTPADRLWLCVQKDSGHLFEPTMPVKTRTWISLWFLITAPIILWDASYCFMRPRSMAGGDLHWIWKPYEIYQEVDHVYGLESLQRNDGFPSAQSFLNVIETLLNLTYLYLAHLSCAPAAPLIGFMAAIMTLSKTILYWAQEYFCGWCATGHNDWTTLLVYWVLPNGFWIVVPAFISYTLGKDIAAALLSADRITVREASRKKN